MSAPFKDEHVDLPVRDAKQALTSFAMYYYQSLVDVGHSSKEAKQLTATLLEETYERYCEIGAMDGRQLGGVELRIAKAMERAKELGKKNLEVRGLYDDLVGIHALITRKR